MASVIMAGVLCILSLFSNWGDLPADLQQVWLNADRIDRGYGTVHHIPVVVYAIWDARLGYHPYIYIQDMKPLAKAKVLTVIHWTRLNPHLWRYCIVWAWEPWAEDIGECNYRAEGGSI
jgi:hypothetical protein